VRLRPPWREVQASAGLRFDFYLATKHKCVHDMKVKLNLPNHVIAAQMGWSESTVEKMVATYAHAEIRRTRRNRRGVRKRQHGNTTPALDPAPR